MAYNFWIILLMYSLLTFSISKHYALTLSLFLLLLLNLSVAGLLLLLADDGRNISLFFWGNISFASYGSNTCRLCLCWWLSSEFSFLHVYSLVGFLLCLLCFLKLIYCLYFYNSIKALQFTPRLKGVLSRVLPVLGNVRDVHRPIFANGMFNEHFPHCWICAIWYWCDYISGKPEHESWF